MENPEAYLGRLKPIHIFKGLKDDEILEIAREFEPERRAAGETVFAQDEEGQSFYIINRGRVKVVRKVRGEDRLVAMLVPGDYFGEAALLYGRRRSATVVAETDVELLRLSKEDFDRLLKQYPQIKPNMLVVVAAAWWFMTWQMALILLALGGAPPAAWITWNAVDWSNDYYIVTNKRVVYLEKIVGIYDSRQEAPLHSVLSVSIQTAGSLARSFGIGDVVVRTFSGPITMKSVPNPQALAALIEEHWARTRTREKEAEQEALKTAVRRRVRPEPPKALAPPAAKPTPPKRPPLRAQVSEFFSFRVRFERGENVIYRKHWYVLLQSIWQPSLFILAALGLIGLKLAGLIPEPVTLAVVVLIALVLFIPFAAWWWYEFEDWKNDIYLVTPDQIVDVSKKPFGQETRKSAPLGNVLSLRYERPGLLGMMLNFGTVIATVAGQEFRFEGVFDPVSVQNDIYRRMEAMNAKKAQAETAKRRDEMADLIGAYQAVLNEISEDAKKQKPPLNPT